MFLVFILNAYKGDEGLLQHELTHIEQSYKGLWIFWLLRYSLSDKYRLMSEIEAYKIQIGYGKLSADRAAYFISKNYRLSISQDRALELLR